MANDAAPVLLLIGTRKGAFVLRADADRATFPPSDQVLIGRMVHHVVQDPRRRQSILMAARTGHLGPTVFRSLDLGKSWKEATRPPAFPKAQAGEKGRVVNRVFWLTPGHASEP